MSAGDLDRVRLAVTQQVVALVTMVGFAVVSARWLGPAGKGELTLITTAGTVAAAVVGLGVPQALTAWVSGGRMTVPGALTVGLVWTVIVAVVTVAVIRFVPSSTLAVRLLGISVLIFLIEQVMSSVSLGAGDMVPPLVSRTAGGAAHVGFFGLAWLLGVRADVGVAIGWYYGLAAAGIVLACVLLAARAARGSHGALPGSRRSVWREVPGIAGFGVKVVPAQILTIANARVDILLLGWLAGAWAVGVYSLAVSASMLVGIFAAALGQALTHGFGAEENPEERLRRGMQVALLSGLVTAFVIVVASPVLVPAVFGASFGAATPLIIVMVPFTALFSTVHVSYPYFYNRLHRPLIHSAVIGTTAAIDVGLVLVLAPRFGAAGAALASAVAYLVGATVNVTVTARGAGMSVRRLVVPGRDDVRWMIRQARATFSVSGRR